MREEYFNWLYDLVCNNRYSDKISYRALLNYLNSVDFVYLVPMDYNRADDGIDLRYRFAIFNNYDVNLVMDKLKGSCTVLEMMIALSIRCEENIMDDPLVGNRTNQWFWGMITSLGLGAASDDNFDLSETKRIIYNFLSRNYDKNGKGGLFTIKDIDVDLRNIEIWNQLCLYLNEIT